MYYKIEGFFYKKKGNHYQTEYIERKFKDKNPFIARKKCFDAYMSFMDVFYMSIGKEYTTHKQAVEDLEEFFVSDIDKIFDRDDTNFIEIKMILSKKEQKYAREFEYSLGEITIHSIGSKNKFDDEKDYCLDGLVLEYKFYQMYFNQHKPEIEIDKNGNKFYKIPINLSSYEDE